VRCAKSADRADVGEKPEECRPIFNARFNGADCTSSDLFGIVLALKVVGDIYRLWQRSGNVWSHHLPKQTLVCMKVHIEQAWQHEAALGIDFGRTRICKLWCDCFDTLPFNENVNCSLFGSDTRVTDN
jgi:hypothetical protein